GGGSVQRGAQRRPALRAHHVQAARRRREPQSAPDRDRPAGSPAAAGGRAEVAAAQAIEEGLMAENRIAPHEILLPVRPGFIAATLVAALLLNLLPWSGYGLWIKPDFVALVVLYWCIETPRRIGFLAAWLLGLTMDVADGTLFGQHALAYTIL